MLHTAMNARATKHIRFFDTYQYGPTSEILDNHFGPLLLYWLLQIQPPQPATRERD